MEKTFHFPAFVSFDERIFGENFLAKCPFSLIIVRVAHRIYNTAVTVQTNVTKKSLNIIRVSKQKSNGLQMSNLMSLKNRVH